MRQEACLLMGQPEANPLLTTPIHLNRPLGAIACPTLAYRPSRYQPAFGDAGTLGPMEPADRNRHFIETPLLAATNGEETPEQKRQKNADYRERMINDLEATHSTNPGQVAGKESHKVDIPKEDS